MCVTSLVQVKQDLVPTLTLILLLNIQCTYLGTSTSSSVDMYHLIRHVG
jgi:hypothetical protein